jgi:hypothetical protein
MNSMPSESTQNQIVNVNADLRWQVYYRLQELDIPCQCMPYKPLQVQLNHMLAAIQLWSVVRSLNSSNQELVDWLDRCWKIDS